MFGKHPVRNIGELEQGEHEAFSLPTSELEMEQ